MLEKIIKEVNKTIFITGAFVTKELIGEPQIDAAKSKVKNKLKELEKLLTDKKENLHRDFYFSTKTKLNSFHSELTRSNKLEKLRKLESDIKSLIEDVKKRSK